MQHQLSQAVEAILKASGWFIGRNVEYLAIAELPFHCFSVAQEVSAEFYGLHFGTCAPGIDCATSDVKMDPRATAHLAEDLHKYERSLGRRLFPLGEVQNSHAYLIIDELGATYLLNDELLPLASSFEEGIENLLLGKGKETGT